MKEIRNLLAKLSQEDKEKIKNIIWLLENDCTNEVDYIVNSIELSDTYRELERKYDNK